MSKKVLVQSITQNGNNYGQVSNPADLQKSQNFAHAHIETATKDFVVLNEAETIGFGFSLPSENGRTVNVAAGRVYDKNGLQFEAAAATALAIEAADALPRIDAIVAVLSADLSAETALIPFQRLRTSQEFASNTAPYAPVLMNQPTEKHNVATVTVKKGVASELVVAPVLASNEVLLYLVSVPANSVAVISSAVNDRRRQVRTLRKLDDDTAGMRNELNVLQNQVETIINDPGSLGIDLTTVFGRITTLAEAIAAIRNGMTNLGLVLPEVVTPGVVPSDPNSGKIPATGNVESGTPVVDIEITGRKIRFGDAEVSLNPAKFPSSLNARFVQISGGSDHARRETALTLSNVTVVDSTGAADFTLKNALLSPARLLPAVGARDGRYVEIFGGLAADGATSLGDWKTYDTSQDTLLPRTFTGTTPPNSHRPHLIPFGDGVNMLLVCPAFSGSAARWFKFNASTGACSEITGTKPAGTLFFGDLIQTGKIFIVATDFSSGAVTTFWSYDTASNTFTQLGATGNIPAVSSDYAWGCTLKSGEFVLQNFTGSIGASSGKTYVFNYSTSTWTLLNIAPPYLAGSNQFPYGFRMANVSGRVRLTTGIFAQPSDQNFSKIWELEAKSNGTYEWRAVETSVPLRSMPGFCSTIRDGLPTGNAFMVAGWDKNQNATSQIYASKPSGLVATTLNGTAGITLAENSSFAQFELPVYNAAWDIGAYLATLAGSFEPGQVKLEASFNDGANYHQITPDVVTAVADSLDPGKSKIRITLYGYSSQKPVLTKLTETFDKDGATQLGTRTVLRYNAVTAGNRWLFVDRNGVVTIETAAAQSTPDRALLQKVMPNGSLAPTVKNYVNKRRAHVRYSKQKLSGNAASGQFDNELASDVAFVRAYGAKASDNVLYKIPIPTVNFDGTITVTGVTDNDTWFVELES